MSEWEEAFRRYELIALVWPPDQRRLLRDAIFASEPVERFVHRLVPSAQALFNLEVRAQIDRLRSAFHRAWKRFGGPDPDVMEDAYHAGIYLLWTDWSGPHWFRGQRRDTWPFVASIHRGPARDSEAALAKVASFCEYVACEYPAGLSEIQRVAIAQHYGVETWLLDATRSYWVALYFASKGGEDGDVGIVRQISPHYWSDLETDVVEVDVPGVRRIERQDAVFLAAPHPDLFDQYVGLELRFRQREGLVFQSTLLGVGDDLLREDDPIMPIVKTWRSTDPMPAGSLKELPKGASFAPLTAEDYFEIVMRGIAARRTVDANDEAALRLICRLHAELQARKLEVPSDQRSLRRLWDAVASILAASHRIAEAPNREKVLDQILAHYETLFPGSYVASLVYALRGDSVGGST